MSIVVVRGSSTPNGLGDAEGGGLAARIRTTFNHRAELLGWGQHGVWDRTTTGESIGDMRAQVKLDRKDARLISALRRGKVVEVIMPGLYDAAIQTKTNLTVTSHEVFAEILSKITRKTLDAGRDVIFVGPTPLGDRQVQLNHREIFDETTRQQNGVIVRSIAEEYGVPYIQLYDVCGGKSAGAEGFISRDGVHPATSAHEIVHRLVQAEVDACFEIPIPEHTTETYFPDTF